MTLTGTGPGSGDAARQKGARRQAGGCSEKRKLPVSKELQTIDSAGGQPVSGVSLTKSNLRRLSKAGILKAN